MEKLTVHSSSNSYEIVVGEGVYADLSTYLTKEYSAVFIITDENVAPLYLDQVKQSLGDNIIFQHIIPAGEQSKSMEQYSILLTKALENGLDRDSLIIALGGGVVGDLAGFVAATFMRGIDFIQLPTTILAHDSSVGGKVAINHSLGKNLIGAFYPPAAVLFDINTLATLSDKETRSGYAELIKEGLIYSEELFETMISKNLSEHSNAFLTERIIEGIKVKADIVEVDEREQGIRSYLNLGHTFAHALEAELGYGEITHGEAVAIGLLFSFHVSEGFYKMSLPYAKLNDWLKENDYPINAFSFNPDHILEKMKTDKKAVKQKIKMVLLKAPDQLELQEISDAEMSNYLQTFKKRLV